MIQAMTTLSALVVGLVEQEAGARNSAAARTRDPTMTDAVGFDLLLHRRDVEARLGRPIFHLGLTGVPLATGRGRSLDLQMRQLRGRPVKPTGAARRLNPRRTR